MNAIIIIAGVAAWLILAFLVGYKVAETKVLNELREIVGKYDDAELFMLELKELISMAGIKLR